MASVSMHVTPFWRQCKYLYVSNFRKMTPRVWINEFSIFYFYYLYTFHQLHKHSHRQWKKIIVTVNYIVNLKKKKKMAFPPRHFCLKKKIFPTFFSWRQKFCNSCKVTLKSINALNFLNQLNCSIKVIPIKW